MLRMLSHSFPMPYNNYAAISINIIKKREKGVRKELSKNLDEADSLRTRSSKREKSS